MDEGAFFIEDKVDCISIFTNQALGTLEPMPPFRQPESNGEAH